MSILDLEYIEIDGLLYPNIETGMESIESFLGKYGILQLWYLHEHKREIYRELLMTGTLSEHCKAIDTIAFWLAELDYKANNLKPTRCPLKTR